MIAIVVHIFMPSPGTGVNVEDFDSRLVSLLGLCYGMSFGLMYLVAMQEVMIEGSPCDMYGKDFPCLRSCIGGVYYKKILSQ